MSELSAIIISALVVAALIKSGGLVLCLEGYYSDCFDVESVNKQTDEAITALREALANAALDRMADNARELGLDYEQPAQSTADKCKLETVPAKGGLLPAQQCVCGEPETLGIHRTDGPSYAEQSAQQEPVANIRTWRKNGELHAELWNWDRGIESLPDGEYDLYTRPQAPATPLHGEPLTDEDIDDIWNHYCDEMGDASINDSYEIARAIEAKLKEKNT